MKVDSMHPLLNFCDHRQDVQFYQHQHLGYHHHNMDQDDGDDVQMGMQDEGGNTKAEMRKSNKPIMEKKRRARINNCLNDLKGILLEAMRKDPARHSKLEKADILELTVRHLQNVQRNQLAIAMATDPTVLLRFKNGFSECATEVSRYMGKLDGVDSGVRHRLSGHLGSCVNGLQQVGPFGGPPRYSTLGTSIPFVPPSPVTNPDKTSIDPSSATVAAAVQIQLVPLAPNNIPPPIPHSIEDLNNNNAFPAQIQPNTANPLSTNPQDVHNQSSHLQNISTSAFTTVARRPPSPLESPVLMSPPSSNDNLNVSVSLSSGSDSSSCAGTTPNISLGLSPLDFSLKVRHNDRTRVLKVEPLMMYDDVNTSMSKGSMWRPW